MKKIFTVVLTLVLISAFATVAFAQNLSDTDLEKHQQNMLELKEEWLDDLVAEGEINQKEADDFIDAREERIESGVCDGSGLGHGDGLFRGMGRGNAEGQGRGLGRGNGCGGVCIED